MIAKFNYSYTDNGREIIEHVCGKVNAFKLKDNMINYEATLSTAYVCVGGSDYPIDKIKSITFYTKDNDIHTLNYVDSNWNIDGQIYSYTEGLERLNQIYINENIINKDD